MVPCIKPWNLNWRWFPITYNCHGVPDSKLSKFNIWPILSCVIEMAPESRDKLILLWALWFRSEKPEMTCFFKPFEKEYTNLSQDGFDWKHHVKQSLRHMKLHPLCCVCDAVARPLLQHFQQINGECRQMASVWMYSKSYSEPWYIGSQIAIMDRDLLLIQPPGTVPQVPRSLTQCKFWKTHEWQHWHFYYSLPFLKGILPQKYHLHWALLIKGVSILLGSELNIDQINHVHDTLNEWKREHDLQSLLHLSLKPETHQKHSSCTTTNMTSDVVTSFSTLGKAVPCKCTHKSERFPYWKKNQKLFQCKLIHWQNSF